MFKGFYNLTSGMLTQQRNLNVVANNLTNVSTAGYKSDRYTASTFDDVMMSRMGNRELSGGTEIGRESYILASSQIYTDFSQGVPEATGLPLDFAIQGEGFFAVQNEDGEVAYTRMGNFSLDEEGYLCLPGQGRVLDSAGETILLATDKLRGDGYGALYSDYGGFLGQIGVYTFADNAALERNDQGLFTGQGAVAEANPTVLWGYIERSNVDAIKQMTEMMSSQRALQSAAQVVKMYDQLMTKATTDLGRM